MTAITPFSNESDSIEIGELTIENRLDQVELYGSVQLTKDKPGLEQARRLKEVIDAVVVALEAEKALPERITLAPVEQVKNPFT